MLYQGGYTIANTITAVPKLMYHASTFLSNPFRRLSAALIRPFDPATAAHLDTITNNKRKEAITGIKHVAQDLSYRATEFVKATVSTAVIAAVAFSVVASSGASLTVIGPALSTVPGIGVAAHAVGVGVHAAGAGANAVGAHVVGGITHTGLAIGNSITHPTMFNIVTTSPVLVSSTLLLGAAGVAMTPSKMRDSLSNNPSNNNEHVPTTPCKPTERSSSFQR